MPSYGLHPQSLVMETSWICSWFERILKFAKEYEKSGGSHENIVFIADRSPFSAVLYCNYGNLLKPIIEQQLKEVKEHAGIDIYSILITVQHEVLWQRIQARLELEPDRALYKEDQREWMEKVSNFYNTFDQWDFEVDNTEEDVTMSLRSLMNRTLYKACKHIPRLHKVAKSTNADLYNSALTFGAVGSLDDEQDFDGSTETSRTSTLGSRIVPSKPTIV